MKDIMGMMKKVGEMQARMKEMQDELARAEFEGQSGGGLVRVTLDGGETVTGRITTSNDGEVTLDLAGDERTLGYADITKAVVQIEFNRREEGA